MKRLVFALLTSLILASCATTHPGNVGKPEGQAAKLPLKISAATVGNARGESFQLVEITLENTSESWLKINRGEVIVGDPAVSKLSVVMGRDLRDWAQAVALREKMQHHNFQMAQLGLTAAGAVVAAKGVSDGSLDTFNTGSALVSGAYSWALYDAIRHSYNDSTQAVKVPENHIHGSASIPAKMFLRRWVLLNKPSNALLDNLIVELETVEGEKERYVLKM